MVRLFSNINFNKIIGVVRWCCKKIPLIFRQGVAQKALCPWEYVPAAPKDLCPLKLPASRLEMMLVNPTSSSDCMHELEYFASTKLKFFSLWDRISNMWRGLKCGNNWNVARILIKVFAYYLRCFPSINYVSISSLLTKKIRIGNKKKETK